VQQILRGGLRPLTAPGAPNPFFPLGSKIPTSRARSDALKLAFLLFLFDPFFFFPIAPSAGTDRPFPKITEPLLLNTKRFFSSDAL